jgi:D-alanine--poly(phosphoribitol) ligase subunit 2
MKTELLTLIVKTVREVAAGGTVSLPSDVDADTPLFGRNGVLDSLGLVTLVVAVEQAIEDVLGVSVSLADARALSQKASPYRTVGTLADYADSLIHTTV